MLPVWPGSWSLAQPSAAAAAAAADGAAATWVLAAPVGAFSRAQPKVHQTGESCLSQAALDPALPCVRPNAIAPLLVQPRAGRASSRCCSSCPASSLSWCRWGGPGAGRAAMQESAPSCWPSGRSVLRPALALLRSCSWMPGRACTVAAASGGLLLGIALACIRLLQMQFSKQSMPSGSIRPCLQGSDDQGLPTERRQGSGRAAAEAAAAAASGRRRRVMVMFIGGVTCAEVGRAAQLSMLSMHPLGGPARKGPVQAAQALLRCS